MWTLVKFTPFLLGLLVGYRLAVNSFDGKLFVYLGESRAPASVRELHDYMPVSGKVLKRSVSEQILAESKFLLRKGRLNIGLGNPLSKGADGLKHFGCGTSAGLGPYDQIELVFEGQGIMESGRSPQLSVQAACRSTQQPAQMDWIEIPIEEIRKDLGRRRHDTELMYSTPSTVRVQFKNLPYVWPEDWVLISVKLWSERDPSRALQVSTDEWRTLHAKRVSFFWPKAE